MPRPKNPCTCRACIRTAILNYNYYQKNHGHPERSKPMPPKDPNFKNCPCARCQTRREDKLRYDYIHRNPEARVGKDFNLVGLGRYSWDRTTEGDYGPKARERMQRLNPRTISGATESQQNRKTPKILEEEQYKILSYGIGARYTDLS